MNEPRALRRCLAAIAFTLLCANVPGASSATPGDISYDQILRVFASGTAPPPGSFEQLKATLGPEPDSTLYPPVPGTPDAGSTEALPRLESGVFYHYSFLGDMARADDPATMRATIALPDKGEVVYLDLKEKSYRVVSGAEATALLSTSLTDEVKSLLPQTLASNDLLGSETLAFSVNAVPLAQRQFAGIAAQGLTIDTAVTTAAHTGSCLGFSVKNKIVVYFDPSRTERRPTVSIPTDPQEFLKAMPWSGCTVTFARPSPMPSSGLWQGLALYVRIEALFDVPLLGTTIGRTSVLERDHLRNLTPADAGQFEIPSDFHAGG